MKLSCIARLLAGIGILASTQVSLASDGTITFTGEITASTCDIINSTGPSFNVTLPPISATSLTTSGATAGWTQFDIELANCATTPSGETMNVMAYFESGGTVDSSSGRLDNQAADGAENVQVVLRDLDGVSNIVIGTPSTQSINVSDGSGVLSYQAGYWATGMATPGPVETSVTYTLDYP